MILFQNLIEDALSIILHRLDLPHLLSLLNPLSHYSLSHNGSNSHRPLTLLSFLSLSNRQDQMNPHLQYQSLVVTEC